MKVAFLQYIFTPWRIDNWDIDCDYDDADDGDDVAARPKTPPSCPS